MGSGKDISSTSNTGNLVQNQPFNHVQDRNQRIRPHRSFGAAFGHRQGSPSRGHQRPLHSPGLHGLHVQIRLHPRKVPRRGEARRRVLVRQRRQDPRVRRARPPPTSTGDPPEQSTSSSRPV